MQRTGFLDLALKSRRFALRWGGFGLRPVLFISGNLEQQRSISLTASVDSFALSAGRKCPVPSCNCVTVRIYAVYVCDRRGNRSSRRAETGRGEALGGCRDMPGRTPVGLRRCGRPLYSEIFS